ncbi:MAG: trypsin-like peptidase domain-containing protein [Candidatus Paceibacterota bacterium]|jgi:serine protease Do
MYQLPKIETKKLKKPAIKKMLKAGKKINVQFLILLFFFIGTIVGLLFSYYLYYELRQEISRAGVPIITQENNGQEYVPQTTEEDRVIKVVKEASPSVVSVIISKEVFTLDFFGVSGESEKMEVGAGSGFIVSSDGMILTNKHVVSDENAEYTVLTSNSKEYSARVLARDPVQDLAILKIEGTGFVPLRLGSSSDIQIGQTVIAIGNALGELQNTVSVGVISGLGRTVTAATEGTKETLEDIIQTDAAINQGNSGGPLLNLSGDVIGINTAVALSGENIGFAIPIDKAVRGIEQVKEIGKISYPFLGVRYVLIDEDLAAEEGLPVSYGAWLVEGINFSQPAVTPGSPAEIAGLKEGDIILEMEGEKISKDNSLAKIIVRYSSGDTISLKILRGNEEIIKSAVLSEWQ